jgi:hypothetical protein
MFKIDTLLYKDGALRIGWSSSLILSCLYGNTNFKNDLKFNNIQSYKNTKIDEKWRILSFKMMLSYPSHSKLDRTDLCSNIWQNERN